MSILIRGMKMPENCRKCPLETDYGTCGFYSLYIEAGHDSDWEKRRDDCPLIELQPHGDLIERKAVCLTDFEIAMCDGDYKEGMKMLLETIENAPTIIPADEGE